MLLLDLILAPDDSWTMLCGYESCFDNCFGLFRAFSQSFERPLGRPINPSSPLTFSKQATRCRLALCFVLVYFSIMNNLAFESTLPAGNDEGN